LDLAWYAIISKVNPAIVDDYTRFPIKNYRDELVAALAGRKIEQSSLVLFRLIVEDTQPYKGGNDAIWALNQLDIAYKHKLLLSLLDVNIVKELEMEDKDGTRIVMAVSTRGRKINDRFPVGSKLKNKGQSSFLVVFDKGLPVENEPVVPTLLKFTEAVDSIVEALESL